MKADKNNPKILMIINEFPPTGESGVQRPLKFLKYLSKENWKTYVITPAKAPKNVFDESLVSEIPKDTKVFKTSSLGFPGKSVDQVANIRFHVHKKQHPIKNVLWKVMKLVNDIVLPIDKQMGWIPFAYSEAIRVIKKYKISNVYITAYPFSAFIVGILLKRKFGDRIFWVADYRDSWQFDTLLASRVHRFRLCLIQMLDELTLRKCDHAVFSTEYQRDEYCKAYPWVEKKSSTITNGFDEDDFKNINPFKFDKTTILFMGKTYNYYVSPIPLLKAIAEAGLDDFQYIHIGSVTKEILKQIGNNRLNFYQFLGYKPHAEALNYAAGADINVVLLNSDEASKGVYSGKIFELLRIGRPILVVGPKTGLVKDLIERNHAGKYAWLNDKKEIIQCIHELLENPKLYSSNLEEISMFSRENLTQKLIAIFENR